MARYIDEKDVYALVGERGMSMVHCAQIDALPRVDVVPKSEEGAECPTCYGTGRIGTTNWLTKNMTKKQIAEEKAQAIAEHEQHIKTEVAREIFEDIAQISCRISESDGNGNMRILCYQLSSEKLAELKKKYTEGEE